MNIKQLSTQVHIDLSKSALSDDDLLQLAEVLGSNNVIQSLDLASNEINSSCLKLLIPALEKNKTLTNINLSRNNISSRSINKLSALLEKNKTITALNLSDNDFSDSEIIAIANMLEKNKSLTSIMLCANSIGDRGISLIAIALKKNKTLMHIDLSCNKISPVGAKILAELLECNDVLRSLELNSNVVGFLGATAFAKCLKINKTLRSIHLGNCSLDLSDARFLAEALKTNVALECLEINWASYAYTNNAGAWVIGEMLESNKTLRSLTLNYCGLKQEDYTALARAIKGNKTLHELNLQGNPANEFRSTEFIDALKMNRTLTSLQTELSKYSEVKLKVNLYIERNCIISELESLARTLQGNIYWQCADSTKEYCDDDPSQRPYFKVTEIHDSFMRILKSKVFSENYQEWFLKQEIIDLKDWLFSLIAQFHLRCIENITDVNHLNKIEVRISAAEDCLTRITKDCLFYKTLCFYLGQQYSIIALMLNASHLDTALVYAKSALNYFECCCHDRELIETNLFGEIWDLQKLMASIVLQFEGRLVHYGILTPEFPALTMPTFSISSELTKAELVAETLAFEQKRNKILLAAQNTSNQYLESALLKKIDGEKIMVSENPQKSEEQITQKLTDLLVESSKFSFHLFLDKLSSLLQAEYEHCKKGRGHFSFFAGKESQSPEGLQQAIKGIEALKQILNAESFSHNPNESLQALKNSIVAKQIDDYLGQGYANPILDAKIKLLDDWIGYIQHLWQDMDCII